MKSHDTPLDRTVPLRATVGFTLLSLFGFGLAYSLAGAGLGRAMFADTATGSLASRDGHVVGSLLVAQPFADARYAMPRPSAAKYDPMSAAGSNMARSNPDLAKRIQDDTRVTATREHVAPDRLPADLVTQSGSGLDPHISPDAARLQIPRIAKARGMSESDVRRLVDQAIEPPQFGVLGAARVNVLALNLALDASKARAP